MSDNNPDDFDSVERRLARAIPADVSQQLTPDQISRLIKAIRPLPAAHIVTFKASLPWFHRRFYTALFVGEDFRSPERLQSEGQLDFVPVSIAVATLVALFVIYAIVPISVLLYLAKSALGIDFFPGPSPMHGWLCGD